MLSQESIEHPESSHAIAVLNPNVNCESARRVRTQSSPFQSQPRRAVGNAAALLVVDRDDGKGHIAGDQHRTSAGYQGQDRCDEYSISSSSTTSAMNTDSANGKCSSSSGDSSSCRSLFSIVASVEEDNGGVVQRRRLRSPSCGIPSTSCTPAEYRRVSAPRGAAVKKQDVGDRLLLSKESCSPSPASRVESGPLESLSDEQLFAFHQVVQEGRSVFITGGAGTGKSYLLRQIIASLPSATTFVTATTGLAAMNLGGTTLHRFAGCGLAEPWSDRKMVLCKMQGSRRCRAAWRSCRVLVIDEVSMLDAWFFDLLEYAARRIRQRPYDPFGGIQLVLSGDFLQLPPVVKQRQYTGPVYCFESEAWLTVDPYICLLTKPFRQKNAFFFRLLNQIRFGQMDTESLTFLASLSARAAASQPLKDLGREQHLGSSDRAQAVRDPLVLLAPSRLPLPALLDVAPMRAFDGYTLLRSKRTEVDQENAYHFRELNTEVFMYQGFHTGNGEFPSQNIQKVVELRVGCCVMLIKNHETMNSLVNGSTGTVTGFIDLARGGYALSRSSLTREEVLRLCCGQGGDANRRHTKLPIVKFNTSHPSGGGPSASAASDSLEIVVEPRAWLEMSGETVLSSTVQLPLILSYAITIHKSQGMSLTKVDIDLKNCFEAGQAYVALSRCTDFNQVHLNAFDMRVVTPNMTALAYYKALELDAQRQARRPAACLSKRSRESEGEEGEGDRRGGRASARVDALRRVLALHLELAAQVRRRTMQQVQPAETARHARLVMDASALFGLITAAGSALKYDLIFGTNGNMMRLPDAVRRFLVEVATLPGQAEEEAGTSHEEAAKGSDRATESLCDVRNVAAEALALIERAKSDFVLDTQGEDHRRAIPARTLPEWQRYTAVLPLLGLQRSAQPPSVGATAPRSTAPEGAGDAIAWGAERTSDAESIPPDTLSDEEWGFVFNQPPRENLLCREILEYAIFLREMYGPNLRVCTDSLMLASYSMAFGLQVVSMGFLAPSPSSNAHLKN